MSMRSTEGKVFWIGIGFGAPEELTARARDLLRCADTVAAESPFPIRLRRFLKPDARLRLIEQKTSLSARETAAELAREARAGRVVVRAVYGDPLESPRAVQEITALARGKTPYEALPAVSLSSLAVRAAGASPDAVLRLPPEAGGKSRPLQLRLPSDAVVSAPVRGGNVPAAAKRLMTAGLPPETPAAAVGRSAWGGPTLAADTLGVFAAQGAAGLHPPLVLVTGKAPAPRRKPPAAFPKPLAGLRIVVTRAREQAEELIDLLEDRGATALLLPCLRIVPPRRTDILEEALDGLGSYDWILFTSVNGVEAFFERFFARFGDARSLGGARIAAVGPKTAERVKAYRLGVDLVPERHTGAALAQALRKHMSLENLRILLPRAEKAPPDLPQALEDMGAIVDDIACYRVVRETQDEEALRVFLEEGADWATFASPSAVEALAARAPLPELAARFPALRFAAIGPETAAALEARGARPHATARPHTAEGLVAAIEERETKDRLHRD